MTAPRLVPRSLPGIFLVFCLTSLAEPRVARAASNDEGVARVAVSADSVDALRGTEQPIPRRVSTVRSVARGVLFIPYAGVRVATWPLGKLAEAEDRARVFSGLADLLRFGYERGAFRSTLFFGYESGVGLSLAGLDATAADWPEPGAKLRLSGGYRSQDQYLAAVRFRSAPHLVQWEANARLSAKPRRPFHGFGPESGETAFDAQRRRVLFEATAALRPADGWKAALTGYLRREELQQPDANDEGSVGAEFPELFAIAEESDYEGAETELSWDTRDAEAFSMKGSFVRLLGGVNRASSKEDADYRHWLGELQTNVNLWRGTRVLALRAIAEGVTSDDPANIPYTELVRMGGKTGLRGFSSDRFTDRTGVILTAEYRYPVTTRMRGNLFADWGTVAPRFDELQLSDVDPSIGFGLAYFLGDNALLTHIAHGSEGFQFYVGSETIFESRSRRLR